jgi:hypothetical protein
MNLSQKFHVGQKVAGGFTVREIVNNKHVGSPVENPIIDFAEMKLDCLYENLAVLSFATFKEKPPSSQDWIKLSLSGKENILKLWDPQRVKLECVCIDYKKRTQSSQLVAVSHIIAAKKNILVSAQLMWFGFPFINRMFVGFKPGMRDRTEELLLGGVKII